MGKEAEELTSSLMALYIYVIAIFTTYWHLACDLFSFTSLVFSFTSYFRFTSYFSYT